MTEHRCSDCRYWDDARYSTPHQGYCRVRAAQLGVENRLKGCWPVTDATDWCGEFRGIFKTDEVNFDTDAGCDP